MSGFIPLDFSKCCNYWSKCIQSSSILRKKCLFDGLAWEFSTAETGLPVTVKTGHCLLSVWSKKKKSLIFTKHPFERKVWSSILLCASLLRWIMRRYKLVGCKWKAACVRSGISWKKIKNFLKRVDVWIFQNSWKCQQVYFSKTSMGVAARNGCTVFVAFFKTIKRFMESTQKISGYIYFFFIQG